MTSIQRATTKHLQPLSELFDQYRQFYNMPSAENQSTAFLIQRLQNQDSIILLAMQETGAAGFAQLYPSFSSVAMKPLWILNDLFVAPAFRRQGVAKKLMQSVEILAKQSNVFSIKLATQVDNNNAKALYDSFGYKKIEQFDHYSKRVE